MKKLGEYLMRLIDHFYPPFRGWVPEEVFRYAACGGGNMVLDWVLYAVLYNFVIGHELIYVGSKSVMQVCISPHILTLCIVFPITLLTGFWLNKYVTFTMSTLPTGKQLRRYVYIVLLNLAINYVGLKLCVDVWGWYPTPSKVVITLVTVCVSFFGQKYFSFRR